MTEKNQADLGRRLVAAIRASENASDRVGQNVGVLLGLNRTDGRCLDIIGRSGGITAGALAEETGLSTGAATTAIDRLVAAGYARRVSDPLDRRKVRLETTELTNELVGLLFGRAPALGQALAGQWMRPEQVELIIRFLNVNAELNRKLAGVLHAQVTPAPEGNAQRLERARQFDREVENMIAALEKRR